MLRVIISCAVLNQIRATGLGGIGGIGGVFSPAKQSEANTKIGEDSGGTQFGIGGLFVQQDDNKKSEEQQLSPGFGGLGGIVQSGENNNSQAKLETVSKTPIGSLGSLGQPKLVQPTQKSQPVENPCNSETNGNCEHYCREATKLEIDEVKGNDTLKLTSSLVFVTESYAIVCYCATGFTLREDRYTCSNDEERRLKEKLDELTYLSKEQDTWVVPVIIVCLIGALTILLMGGLTYFCVRKTDKQREVLAHSISTQSSTVLQQDPAVLAAALSQMSYREN